MGRLLFLDAETYYDKEYSLKKMAPPNYILDPRFEMIMLGVREGDKPSYLVDGPAVADFFKSIDPKTTTCVTFNALFDMSIFAWRYGWVPAMMLDAMGMTRALRGHLLASTSLAATMTHFGVGEKGHEVTNMIGMHRADILASGQWHAYARYCLNDVDGTARIFDKLLPEFPASERRVMDRVLRCAIEPTFQIDVKMLQEHITDVAAEKAAALAACGVVKADLMSTPKFCALLEALGVDVETKVSATGNIIPALAKTDEFIAGLLEHEDEQVAALAAARLGEKSTIEETRGSRLLSIAGLDWSCYRPGNWMPVPYAYGRAHTHRLAGDWKMNMQNLPSGRGGKVTKLRKALIAPAGHKVLVADLSQIEARITAWLVGQLDLLKQFADDLDPYSQLGAKIFGMDCGSTKEAIKAWRALNALIRFIGKTGVLGLGFRCGANKFYNMAARDARKLGMNMSELLAVWTPGLAQKSVDTYRTVNKAIRNSWYQLDRLIATAWMGNTTPAKFGTNNVVEIGHGYVLLPNGMKLNYACPRLDPEDNEHKYTYGKHVHKIHGGTLLENIVQALARIVVMNAALRLWDRGYRFRLQSHDELAFIVKDEDVDSAKAVVLEELRRPPSWARDLPLDAEAGVGQSYGDAK